MGLTRYAAVVIRAYYFVCAKFLVLTRALIPACRFSVVPVVLWSCRAYMFLTRAKYSAYLLSASSRAVDLSLSFVCVLWEPDPSLEPMGVLQRENCRPVEWGEGKSQFNRDKTFYIWLGHKPNVKQSNHNKTFITI